MAPFMDTAGIEILGIPGTLANPYKSSTSWAGSVLKARLAILGPRGVQAQTMTYPIQMSQRCSEQSPFARNPDWKAVSYSKRRWTGATASNR